MFLLVVALRARQNTAQLINILSDLHTKPSHEIYVFTRISAALGKKLIGAEEFFHQLRCNASCAFGFLEGTGC